MKSYRRLYALLNRIREYGLTLNGRKCQFRHGISRTGVQPREEKVTAILNVKPPQNASEVRSFMGLVQQSSKFLCEAQRSETLSRN